MAALFAWFESHDKLAGWAQFAGAMLALMLTYLTAFAPVWRRKKQLTGAAERLLLHGYEVMESYHRTSANFLPFSLSLRAAALSMASVAEEIGRFPVFELDDQGPLSIARRLAAMRLVLSMLHMFLENTAGDLETGPGSAEDQKTIRDMVAQQMEVAKGLVQGTAMQRPAWPGAPSSL